MGRFIKHIQCEECGSSDANSLYDDGSTYCFACQTYGHADSEDETKVELKEKPKNFLKGDFQDLKSRGIREETCRKFDYRVGEYNGEPCHIANYRNDKNDVVAQKVRLAGKKFTMIGNGKGAPLYGQSVWGTGGKSVVITEGELDALSVSQAFNNKYPVVSLPNGADSAVASVERAYEWLDTFDKIVLCFDDDEPGHKATEKVAAILPAGKAYIMTLPYKDANETLINDGTAPIVSAFWSAKQWRPDGIVSGSEITLDRLRTATARGYSLRYPRLDDLLGGLREREITLLTAGTGIGKSTLAREIAYGLHQDHNLIIGNLYLEESVEKTAQGYIAIDNNVPLGVLRRDPTALSDDAWNSSLARVIHQRMYFFDHFGSLDSILLLAKIRYMRVVLKCNFVILDHISIVISGNESSSEGERRDIDMLMTRLRSLVEETGVGIVAIVHLKQPDGKAHEEGGRVTLSHLRGSGSLKHIPDSIVALERDQQDPEAQNECQIRILKNREFGEVGEADRLEYDKKTGRLNAIEEAF